MMNFKFQTSILIALAILLPAFVNAQSTPVNYNTVVTNPAVKVLDAPYATATDTFLVGTISRTVLVNQVPGKQSEETFFLSEITNNSDIGFLLTSAIPSPTSLRLTGTPILESGFMFSQTRPKRADLQDVNRITPVKYKRYGKIKNAYAGLSGNGDDIPVLSTGQFLAATGSADLAYDENKDRYYALIDSVWYRSDQPLWSATRSTPNITDTVGVQFNWPAGQAFVFVDNTASPIMPVTVTAVNDDQPVLNNQLIEIDVLANDVASGGLPEVSLLTPVSEFSMSRGGLLRFTPPASFTNGTTWTADYIVSIGAMSDTATVTFTANSDWGTPSPTTLLASPDFIRISSNSPVTIDVLANDVTTGGSPQVAMLSASSGFTYTSSGMVVFTPPASFSAGQSWSAQYILMDGMVSDTATIMVIAEVDFATREPGTGGGVDTLACEREIRSHWKGVIAYDSLRYHPHVQAIWTAYFSGRSAKAGQPLHMRDLDEIPEFWLVTGIPSRLGSDYSEQWVFQANGKQYVLQSRSPINPDLIMMPVHCTDGYEVIIPDIQFHGDPMDEKKPVTNDRGAALFEQLRRGN